MNGRALSAVVVAAGLVGVVALPGSHARSTDDGVVFRLQDQRIDESSGLVDLGDLMVTTNDSGDSARVFVIDPETGQTVGVTDFDAEVRDVEALAPAGASSVWVADIGDNTRSRPWVSVYRVPVGARQIQVSRPEVYYLNYPDGPRDAESLVVDSDGRLVVIAKDFGGGRAYRAPTTLSATTANLLEPIGKVPDYATDAAMTADGRRLVVRSLGVATIYAYPGLRQLTTFELPQQRQGEGLSLGPGDRVRLSTEGAGTAVRELSLPTAAAAAARSTPSPTAPSDPARTAGGEGAASPGSTGSTGSGSGEVAGAPDASAASSEGPRPGWLPWTIPGVVALGAAVIAFALRRHYR